jgi:hypothetical protein
VRGVEEFDARSRLSLEQHRIPIEASFNCQQFQEHECHLIISAAQWAFILSSSALSYLLFSFGFWVESLRNRSAYFEHCFPVMIDQLPASITNSRKQSAILLLRTFLFTKNSTIQPGVHGPMSWSQAAQLHLPPSTWNSQSKIRKFLSAAVWQWNPTSFICSFP